MIQPQQAKDRGLQIADVLRVFHCSIAEFIRAPVNSATLDASSRQPGSEALGIVVAPGCVL